MHIPRRTIAASTATLLGLGVLAVVGAPPATAAACTIEQLTSAATGGVFPPSIDSAGDRIAFTATEDLTGGNPTHQERLFLWDRNTAITQLTTGQGFQGSIAGDGTRVAFTSLDDLVPTGNPEGNQDVYEWIESPSPHLVQLSSTGPTSGVGAPQANEDGTRVAFGGFQAAGENTEVWLWVDDGTPATTQLTVTSAPEQNNVSSIDAAGTHVSYWSNRNLGGNADGNSEVWVHNTAGGGSDTQVTTSTGGELAVPNRISDLNDAGTRLVFRSDRDFGGGNSDGSFEVFTANANGSGSPTRLTGSAESGFNRAAVPRSDGAGDRTAFYDTADLTGDNPDHSTEVFVRDVGGSNHLTSLTSGTLGSSSPSINGDGTLIAFTSAADLTGQNPDGNAELFLAHCGPAGPTFSDVAFSNAFYDQIEWMAELGIASGFPNGTFHPGDPVKRQQMAGFLYNLAGQPAFTPPVTPTFNDVPVSSPFYLQVEWMASEGIASGFPDGGFHPQDPVKRQQMANFLYNLAGQPSFTPPVTPTFSDYPPSSTYYPQVEWMAAEEIASGFPDGTFRPLDPVKRQQMANFVFNFATCCEVAT